MKNIGRFFYFEFLFVIKDYAVTIKFKELIFDWILPFIFAFIFRWIFLKNLCVNEINDFNGYVINVFAILIGFSLTSLTILSTSNSKNINQLKEKIIKRKIGGKNISLYQLIFITFSFGLLIEIFALIFSLFYFLFIKIGYSEFFIKNLFIFYLLLLIHIIFLNIRNITNFYFIFLKKDI